MIVYVGRYFKSDPCIVMLILVLFIILILSLLATRDSLVYCIAVFTVIALAFYSYLLDAM